nr:putative periaxin [bacterium]
MVVPESPPYAIPSSLLATSWVVPFSSWYLMRVISSPLRLAAPFSAVISTLFPSLPLKPMCPTPSLPDMDTASLPFLSVTATLPSVPFAASGPVRDTPSLPSLPTFTDSALRFLFIFTSIVVLPVAASCLMKVLILSPL